MDFRQYDSWDRYDYHAQAKLIYLCCMFNWKF